MQGCPNMKLQTVWWRGFRTRENSSSSRKRKLCIREKVKGFEWFSSLHTSNTGPHWLTFVWTKSPKVSSFVFCRREKCTRVWTDVRASFKWTSPLILSLRVLSYLYLWRMWWICWMRSTSSLQMMASGMKIRWTIRWRPAPVSPQSRMWNSPLRPHPKVSRLHPKDPWYVMALEFLLAV